MTTIDTADLAAAVADYPPSLAADITTWVRAAEEQGKRFASASDAASAAFGSLAVTDFYRSQPMPPWGW